MSVDLEEVFADLEPGGAMGPRGPKRSTATSAPSQSTRPALPLEWANDLADELEAPAQIVEGVITAGGLSVIYGESNSGKTYLALHLGICVSLGDEWLGKRTTKGTVIYIAAEGAWSVRTRLAAFRNHFGKSFGHLALIPCSLTLLDPGADVEDLVELLLPIGNTPERPDVSLVIVDTLARVMGGANENASEDMSRLVGACDRIRQATGAHVLLIHHSGKDAAKGARGHSSLRAAVDTEIEVTADETTHIHTAKITKQRDLASKGERVAGKFVSVELGVDQWGNAITACAVEPADASNAPAKPRPMPQSQQAVLGYLVAQSVGVRRRDVSAALETQGISVASVYRSINALIDAGRVMDTMGKLYVPKQ